ncbi:hypothetical protein BCR42DRAFT_420706 [Absidia repens]|uniref:rhomboid protease n=1 Tax=Absidia repens TaxID=90262 RepID=A0A1X2IA52_9FUNG|nr:hypothetical protein BCR42DRAFT_420706 [Absidia repens]
MEGAPQNTNQQGQQWTSSRDRAGEATRMFVTHIRHYFNSLPLISVLTIIIPLFANLLDVITFIGPTHNTFIYEWFYLSQTKIIYHLQVYRLIFYPLVHVNVTSLLTNLLLLIPYISAHERKKGSVCLLHELLCLFTLLPAIMYIVVIVLITSVLDMSGVFMGVAACSGLSTWTVALSLWTMLDEDARGEATTHSLFGVIPLPPKSIPFLIIAFYFFLVPDSSLILHLCAASVAYFYFHHRLPSVLEPTNEKCRHFENHRWTKLLSNHPKFISVDTSAHSGSYLPVTSNGVGNGSTTSYTQQSTSSASATTNFPGQGYTLSED